MEKTTCMHIELNHTKDILQYIKMYVSEDLPVGFPVGGVDGLSFTAIPCMDEALTANSPKLLFVAAVRSVFTTEASDTIDANSRASSTIKLPQLQVQKQ